MHELGGLGEVQVVAEKNAELEKVWAHTQYPIVLPIRISSRQQSIQVMMPNPSSP